VTAAANTSLHYTNSFRDYIDGSIMFTELRLCPCYNMIPRAMMENFNCRPSEAGYETLSSTYLLCNAVDMDAIYSAPEYGFIDEAGLALVRVSEMLLSPPDLPTRSTVLSFYGGGGGTAP